MRIRLTVLAGASVVVALSGLTAAGAAAAQAKTVPGKAAATRTAPAAMPQPASVRAWARALRSGLGQSPATAGRPGREVRPDGIYHTGLIELYDANVLSAQGCADPANVIEYPWTPNGCDSGENEVWGLDELANGYDAIIASYGGNLMCLNMKGNSYAAGTQIITWPCNNVVTGNEQFRRPENTPDPGWGNGSGKFIVPAGNYSMCLNSAGGLGTGHNIILYPCSTSYDNEVFFFP